MTNKSNENVTVKKVDVWSNTQKYSPKTQNNNSSDNFKVRKVKI